MMRLIQLVEMAAADPPVRLRLCQAANVATERQI